MITPTIPCEVCGAKSKSTDAFRRHNMFHHAWAGKSSLCALHSDCFTPSNNFSDRVASSRVGTQNRLFRPGLCLEGLRCVTVFSGYVLRDTEATEYEKLLSGFVPKIKVHFR